MAREWHALQISRWKPVHADDVITSLERDVFPHGWRSSFSTIMNEQAERDLGQDLRLLADRMIIDFMLAHTPAGMSGSELRYNRAAYMPRRRELAQRWADLIMFDALPVEEIIHSPRRKPR